MSVNASPDFKSHADFFYTLSTLNRYDKLSGKKVGNKIFKWTKNETGWLQGSKRAMVNGYENTKKATISSGKILLDSLIPAGFKKPQELPLLESGSSESIIVKAPLPDFLGDAEVLSRGIKKEGKEISNKLDICASFIENCSDIGELDNLKKDLEFVELGLRANKTGLANLKETYRGEVNSPKQLIKRKKEKYIIAVENLNRINGKIDVDLQKIGNILDAIDKKIQSLGNEQSESLIISDNEDSHGVASHLTKKPVDFPKTVDAAPCNMQVAISQFLSNPFNSIQSDNRQIYCEMNGELSLQGDMGDSTKTDVHNFLHMVTETYGPEVRNLIINILNTDSREFLTFGDVKLTLALVAVLVNPAIASRLKGQEKCFTVLAEKDREKVAADPKKNYILTEFAMKHLVDHQGVIRGIQDLFPKQYEVILDIVNKPEVVQIKNDLEQRLLAAQQKAQAKRK